MIIRFDKQAILQYILLYICMLNTASKAASMYGNSFIIFTFALSLVVILLGIVKLEKKPFLIIGGLFALIFLQHVLLQNDISVNSIMNTLSKFVISYCAVAIDKEHFFKRFVRLVVIVACISLPFFFATQLGAGSIVSKLLITNHASCWTGNISYGRFIYHYMPGYERNVGIYNEPGVYQLYLNLALLIILFKNDEIQFEKKETIWYSIILIATIITAMSTTGYVEMFVIVALYLISLKKEFSPRTIIILIAAVAFVAVFSQTDLFNDRILVKLAWSDEGRFETGTGNARLASAMLDFNYIVQNPLGYGYSGTWTNTSSFASNEVGSSVGLTSMVCVYGIFIALIVYSLYIFSLNKIGKSAIEKLAIFASFVLAFSSQPWILNPIYLTLMMYGLTGNAYYYDDDDYNDMSDLELKLTNKFLV